MVYDAASGRGRRLWQIDKLLAHMANLEMPVCFNFFCNLGDMIRIFICSPFSFFLLVQSCFLPWCSSILLQHMLHFHRFHSGFSVEWHQILPICTEVFLSSFDNILHTHLLCEVASMIARLHYLAFTMSTI